MTKYHNVDVSGMKFLPIDVFKNDGPDCSMNGVSVTSQIYVKCSEGIYTAEELVGRKLLGEKIALMHIVPGAVSDAPNVLKEIGKRGWSMFGGNFAWSCDSRISRMMPHGPLKIMDRFES